MASRKKNKKNKRIEPAKSTLLAKAAFWMTIISMLCYFIARGIAAKGTAQILTSSSLMISSAAIGLSIVELTKKNTDKTLAVIALVLSSIQVALFIVFIVFPTL